MERLSPKPFQVHLNYNVACAYLAECYHDYFHQCNGYLLRKLYDQVYYKDIAKQPHVRCKLEF
jgi:hypothetical protein